MVIKFFRSLIVHIACWRLKNFDQHLMRFNNHVWLIHGNPIGWQPNFFNRQILRVPLVLVVPLI
jgi:hypothetical protein